MKKARADYNIKTHNWMPTEQTLYSGETIKRENVCIYSQAPHNAI